MKFEIEIHHHFHPASVENLFKKELASLSTFKGNIMSAISDFARAQASHNERMGTALTGLSEDIAALNAKISELQSTSGAITAEDQTLLDELQVQAEALASRIEEADALTPPIVPPVA